MKPVDHDGRSTAYRLVDSSDTGPTVLYVHGSGATHRVWVRQYTADGPAHSAVALDLSDHGESDGVDAAAGVATLEAYAADVAAVARTVDAAVLVGHSMGGAVVQWATLEGMVQPSALVLTGTGPTLPVFEDLRRWLSDDFERAIEFLHGRDRLLHTTDEQLRDRSRDQLCAVGQAVTRRDFLTCDAFDVTGRLDEITVPTLAVCGEYDTLTPIASHERLVEKIPDCTFAVVPDAAHLAMLERPSVFNDRLAEFFDALPP